VYYFYIRCPEELHEKSCYENFLLFRRISISSARDVDYSESFLLDICCLLRFQSVQKHEHVRAWFFNAPVRLCLR